jgi:hypothetical protein
MRSLGCAAAADSLRNRPAAAGFLRAATRSLGCGGDGELVAAAATWFLKPSRWGSELQAVAEGSFERRRAGGEGAARGSARWRAVKTANHRVGASPTHPQEKGSDGGFGCPLELVPK